MKLEEGRKAAEEEGRGIVDTEIEREGMKKTWNLMHTEKEKELNK